MSPSIGTMVKKIWSKLANKEYRDSFVSAHISNTISSQILTMREQRGWTQKELAKRAGMAQSRIPVLEDPNLENIEIATLKRLASAFDVAITVRFVPFSELAVWTASLSTEALSPVEFANDKIGVQPATVPSGIADVKVISGGDALYKFSAGYGRSLDSQFDVDMSRVFQRMSANACSQAAGIVTIGQAPTSVVQPGASHAHSFAIQEPVILPWHQEAR